MTVTPSTAQLRDTVTRIVAEEFGLDAGLLSPDTDLREVEGASSLKVLRAVAKIERTYDVELEDEDIFSATTVDDVVRVVDEAIAGRPS